MLYTIENDFLTVSVSDIGAEMQSIRSKDGLEYLWQGDATYWDERALNIFPYVARLTDGIYEMDGKRYRLPIHGFAPKATFACKEQLPQRLVMELQDNPETYKQYPRHFSFSIIYQLQESNLLITYRVENRDTKTMYFGIGGHPGFNVPLENGLSFDDYQLRFKDACEPRRIEFSKDCFLTGITKAFTLQNGNVIPLQHAIFDQDAIVLQDMAREVTLESPKGKHGITVSFPQMQYVGFWHWPKTDAPYVCIEPWCSLPATQDKMTVMEQQPDLIKLESGQIYQNNWSIHCF